MKAQIDIKSLSHMETHVEGCQAVISDTPSEFAELLSAPFRRLRRERRGHDIGRGRRALYRQLSATGEKSPAFVCPLPLWLTVRDLAAGGNGESYCGARDDLTSRLCQLAPPTDDTPLVAFITGYPFGIIGVSDENTAIGAATAICTALPAARIIVVAHTHQVVGRIQEALVGAGLGGDLMRTESQWPRLAVGTPVHTDEGVEHADAILFVGIDSIRDRYAELPYEKAVSARRFLIAPARTLTSWDLAKAQSMFGFAELRLLPNGHVERVVGVTWVQHRAHRSHPGGHRSIALLREMVWHAHARNRRIVRLCGELAGERSADYFSDVVSNARRTHKLRRIALLVDTAEHAGVLVDMIDWPVETAELAMLAEPMRYRLERRRASVYGPERRIITAAAANDIDWANVDVVVRADAGVGLPPIPPHAADGPLLIIDVADRRNAVLSRLTNHRRQAYQHAGWFAAQLDPELERLREFQRGLMHG